LLLRHPAVEDVAVIGVADDTYGETVKAVVQLRPGVQPERAVGDSIMEFCRRAIARYKCPRSVDFVDQLPRYDTGKLYKRRLRERYDTA
jgi:long-chain acyl-CoA synthetase